MRALALDNQFVNCPALILGKPCMPFTNRLKVRITIRMFLYLCQYSMYISLYTFQMGGEQGSVGARPQVVF